MKKLMQTLFSITKNPNIKYKTTSILGFKIKTISKQYVQKLEQLFIGIPYSIINLIFLLIFNRYKKEDI